MGLLIRTIFVLGCVVMTACNDDSKPKAGGAAARQQHKIGAIAFSLAVPASWTVETDPIGEPTFKVPALEFFDGPAVVRAYCPEGTSGDACLEALAAKDFVKSQDRLQTERRGGGLWARVTRDNGAIHHRFYRLAPDGKTVLTGVVQLTQKDLARLAELEAFCESLEFD
jgi:hypothetical protein